ncbi:MAG: DUF5716 family protein [Defluviitaleaceae bacterium]|nr:DUF5716 family protein [Defluviitaleaceae bacterium]
MKRKIKHTLKEDEFVLGIDIGDIVTSCGVFDKDMKDPSSFNFSDFNSFNIPTILKLKDNIWSFGNFVYEDEDENGEIFSNFLSNADYSLTGIFVDQIINFILEKSKKKIKAITVVTSEKIKNIDMFKSTFEKYKDYTYFENYGNCVFEYYYFKQRQNKENLILIDYSATSLSLWGYNINKEISEILYFENKNIITNVIEEDLILYFINLYKKEKNDVSITKYEEKGIKTFIRKNKESLFLKSNKNLRLQFNFCEPPIIITLNQLKLSNIKAPYEEEFKRFLKYSLIKSNIDISDINTIICTGGGFEMEWVRDVIQNIFLDSHIKDYKPYKSVASMGAVLLSIKNLRNLQYENSDKIPNYYNMGIFAYDNGNKKYIPIFNNFKNTGVDIIINHKFGKKINIDIFNMENDETSKIYEIEIDDEDIICRPSLALKINILMYMQNNKIIVKIKDKGFGDLFPAGNFEKTYEIENF